jgi:hypothetical protein
MGYRKRARVVRNVLGKSFKSFSTLLHQYDVHFHSTLHLGGARTPLSKFLPISAGYGSDINRSRRCTSAEEIALEFIVRVRDEPLCVLKGCICYTCQQCGMKLQILFKIESWTSHHTLYAHASFSQVHATSNL